MTDDEFETLIAGALQQDAAALMREIVLPGRDLLLWKARLYARRQEAKRATRAIDRFLVLEPVLALVLAASFGIASGSFGRIAAMPAVLGASVLAALLLAAAPFCLSKIGGLE